jgi:hypothetical protein
MVLASLLFYDVRDIEEYTANKEFVIVDGDTIPSVSISV